GKKHIGICWAGSAKYVADSARSMGLSDFTPLFELKDCAFYSLQLGQAAEDLKNLGLLGLVADVSPMLKSWQATAEIVMGLDVVVTVDTAIAHLAAALGKPTFVMIPYSHCW